jgi:hypothetical protein
MGSIPASEIVNINANVLSAGGSQLSLNGVFLTENTLLANGELKSFSTYADTATFFGATSEDAKMAAVYFNGYSIAQSRPGRIYFYRVGTASTSATYSTGAITDPLASFQVNFESNILVTVDGIDYRVVMGDYSAATSLIDFAAMMEANILIVTGAIAAPGAFSITYNTTLSKFVFSSLTTGTGSTITIATSVNSVVSSLLKLTSLLGSTVSSPGTTGSIPAGGTIMNALTDLTTNWATFTSVFEPTLATKKEFVDWVNGKNAEYVYVCWDTDITNNVVNLVTDNINNYVKNNTKANTFIVGKQAGVTVDLNTHAAFVCGIAASVDFSQTNNRPTWAFKLQSGIVPSVSNATVGQALIDNGVNFYGAYATRNDEFKFLYPGQVSGDFQWMDSLINAIYMKAKLQQTWMTMLVSISSIPYNDQGKGFLRVSATSDFESFKNFGAIRSGIRLAGVQAAAINNAAGLDISEALYSQGWYLQIKDASPTDRQNRLSFPINIWYTDGQSVHYINATMTNVQ